MWNKNYKVKSEQFYIEKYGIEPHDFYDVLHGPTGPKEDCLISQILLCELGN